MPPKQKPEPSQKPTSAQSTGKCLQVPITDAQKLKRSIEQFSDLCIKTKNEMRGDANKAKMLKLIQSVMEPYAEAHQIFTAAKMPTTTTLKTEDAPVRNPQIAKPQIPLFGSAAMFQSSTQDTQKKPQDPCGPKIKAEADVKPPSLNGLKRPADDKDCPAISNSPAKKRRPNAKKNGPPPVKSDNKPCKLETEAAGPASVSVSKRSRNNLTDKARNQALLELLRHAIS